MPSRPLFKAYTHIDPFLHIPDEQQGTAPRQAAAKPSDPNSSAELATSVGSAVSDCGDCGVEEDGSVCEGFAASLLEFILYCFNLAIVVTFCSVLFVFFCEVWSSNTNDL